MENRPTKILYLEDEHFLGRIVKESLSSRGYDIKLVSNGANFMQNFEHFNPDICVLDIMVPNIDGYTIAQIIREKSAQIPIVFLSAKNQTKDVLEGFKSGGNDYLKKPFSMEELIVRIENLLNFKNQLEPSHYKEKIQIGLYSFDYNRFELTIKDKKVQLSHRENELLLLFSKNINRKLDRSEILKKIWGDDSLYNSRNLDVYIRKLRVYFNEDPNIQIITLRGVGYHFSVNEK